MDLTFLWYEELYVEIGARVPCVTGFTDDAIGSR